MLLYCAHSSFAIGRELVAPQVCTYAHLSGVPARGSGRRSRFVTKFGDPAIPQQPVYVDMRLAINHDQGMSSIWMR